MARAEDMQDTTMSYQAAMEELTGYGWPAADVQVYLDQLVDAGLEVDRDDDGTIILTSSEVSVVYDQLRLAEGWELADGIVSPATWARFAAGLRRPTYLLAVTWPEESRTLCAWHLMERDQPTSNGRIITVGPVTCDHVLDPNS